MTCASIESQIFISILIYPQQVVDLAGFLILTCFIQFPIHVYLLLSLFDSFSTTAFVIQTIALSFLPFEILINFIIIRKSLRQLKLQYQMMRSFDEDFNKND